jgi:hypothetical protein
VRDWPWSRRPSIVAIGIVLLTAATAAQSRVTFEQARPVIEALRANLPPTLRGLPVAELEARWPSWVDGHDRAVRARLNRGDEDSLVNLWSSARSSRAS